MNPTTPPMGDPEKAPPIPPMPTTEPTARRGNISEASVKIFADHPWWAAAASPIRATTNHRFLTLETRMIGVTHNAQSSIAVLRALLMVQPRLIRLEESQPPPMLPTSAIT